MLTDEFLVFSKDFSEGYEVVSDFLRISTPALSRIVIPSREPSGTASDTNCLDNLIDPALMRHGLGKPLEDINRGIEVKPTLAQLDPPHCSTNRKPSAP